MRSDRRHAAADVVAPRRRQRRGQARRAATPGRSPASTADSARRPGRRRPSATVGLDPLHQHRPGVAEPLADVGQLGVPHVEGDSPRRRRAARRPGAAACCAGARCGRARGAARRTSPPAPPGCRRGTAAARTGPPLTSVRSSGENTLTRTTPSRSRARARRWRLTCTRLRPVAGELGLDQRRLAPVVVRSDGPHDRRRRRRRGPARRSAPRGSSTAWPGRRSPRRGWSCPARCRRPPRWSPPSSSNVAAGVVAEVDELQALDDHGIARPTARSLGGRHAHRHQQVQVVVAGRRRAARPPSSGRAGENVTSSPSIASTPLDQVVGVERRRVISVPSYAHVDLLDGACRRPGRDRQRQRVAAEREPHGRRRVAGPGSSPGGSPRAAPPCRPSAGSGSSPAPGCGSSGTRPRSAGCVNRVEPHSNVASRAPRRTVSCSLEPRIRCSSVSARCGTSTFCPPLSTAVSGRSRTARRYESVATMRTPVVLGGDEHAGDHAARLVGARRPHHLAQRVGEVRRCDSVTASAAGSTCAG